MHPRILSWGCGIQVSISADEVEELRIKEKAMGIEPDWEIDAFMKASHLRGKEHSIMVDYILRMLGLEACFTCEMAYHL